jgi:hypothetical protein
MAKPKTKPVELWPPWESPDRVKYPDLNEPRSRVFYDQARALFTEDNIEAAGGALNPPVGFDLVGRLRRAVYQYFWCKAGRKGENAALTDLMPEGVQIKALVDLIKKTSKLLSVFEKKPEIIANIVMEYEDRDGASAAYDFSKGLIADLKYLKQMAENKQSKLETSSGSKDDIARRVFCAHLLMIFEVATGGTAKNTRLRAAHDFFTICFKGFISPEISDESTFNYLQDSINARDKIKASPLFSEYFTEPAKTIPAFTAEIVITPASK